VIICHSKKFVFVKTNKTAGSSFEGLLCRHLADGDYLTAIPLKEEKQYIDKVTSGTKIQFLNGPNSTLNGKIKKHFSQHVSLDIAHLVFPETKNYFSFGLIRNPFKRYLSSFRWRQGQPIEKLIKECQNTREAEKKLQRNFLNFIRQDKGMLSSRGRNLLQGTRPDGTTWSVNCIYKLEDLKYVENDLKKRGIINNLITSKMPRFKSKQFKIPEGINLWTKDSIQAVRVASTWEIEQMGYPSSP
tara:strand:+ start:36 stop:767 length:732 start_codon:yes stop_codon:yes gene_type:complete